ncbi:MAG: hypothetical protein ACFFCV_20715 [Promethearchaeota archaeon]
MKKFKILILLTIGILLFIPFGTFAVGQPAGYVGVQEGQEYEWRINLNIDGIDNAVQNVDDLLTEIQSRVSDIEFYGFESMTLPEIMENISTTLLSYMVPEGWEGLNISEFLDETLDHYITKFNSTFLSGEIPVNWQSLNYSSFVGVIIDGLNETLPIGWEDQPLPFMLDLALNELNSTLLMGLLPSGWHDMTLQELLESIVVDSVPVLSESFLPYVMMDQLLSTAYMMLPPGADTFTMDEFLSFMIPSEVWDVNLSYAIDGLWYMINSTSPPGWESEPISTFIDNMGAFLNYSLVSMDPGLEGANMTTIVNWGLNMALYEANMSGGLPSGWDTMTILDLADEQLTYAITQWNSYVLPQWDTLKTTFASVGGFPSTMGIKIAIDQINPEIQSSLGGQNATPIDMTISISMDMETWTNLEDLFSGSSSLFMADPVSSESTVTIILQTILNFTSQGYIVDPSTYLNPQLALYDQFAFTQGLIVANNYDWASVTTDGTISLTGNEDAYEAEANWNSNGLLNHATLSSDGVVAASINLYSEEQEIPGYEIATLMLVFPISIIGIIYYIRKKNR